jgi:ankyrin repeat protein
MTAEVIELAKRAFRDDDAPSVKRILDENPELKQRINEPVGPFESPAITFARSPQMVDVLLDAGADINAKSNWWAGGFGILHSAAPELANYAITRGATVDVHAAARLGMLDELKRLIHNDPELVHARGGDGQTPLHFAATRKVAEYLLDQGADIDALDIDHVSTPAQYMVRSRQDVARYLISRGAKTDILMASALGDEELVTRILDEDPENIRMRVSDEYFPLISAENGGTIYQWELGWYVSPHQVARQFGHAHIFDLLMSRSPDDVKLLTACWPGDDKTVDDILKKDPDVASEMPAAEKRSLAHAARNNELEAFRLMLKAGLPVAGTSQDRGTALHWAAWHGNTEMVSELLAHGADVDNNDNNYDSPPIGWAIYASVHGWHPDQGDYPATVQLLLDAGSRKMETQEGSPAVRAVLDRHRTAAD